MALPIDSTKKSLKDIEAIVLLAIDMFRHPKTGMALTTEILTLVSSSGAVVNNLIAAWPEFQNLDKDEAAQLGGAAYDLIKAIVDKIKGIEQQQPQMIAQPVPPLAQGAAEAPVGRPG